MIIIWSKRIVWDDDDNANKLLNPSQKQRFANTCFKQKGTNGTTTLCSCQMESTFA